VLGCIDCFWDGTGQEGAFVVGDKDGKIQAIGAYVGFGDGKLVG